MSMGARILKILSIPTIIALLSIIGLFSGQFDNFASDPGVGWHLESGRLIIENLKIPLLDPFLAGPERAWVSDQWLSDVVLYFVYNQGGWPALYNLIALIFVATYFFVLLPAVYKSNNSWIASSLGVLFAFKIAQIHFILRPVVFSFPLFAITLAGLVRWNQNRAARTPWYLIFVIMLWSNLHPSFVLGLILIGFLAGSKVINFIANSGSNGLSFKNLWQEIKPVVMLGLSCFFVTIVNPYGLDLHASVIQLGQSEYFMGLNEEWMSPNFKEPVGKLFLLMLAIVFAPPLLGIKCTKDLFGGLLVIFFAYLALKAIRFLPYTGIVFAFAIPANLLILAESKIFVSNPLLSTFKKAVSSLEDRQVYYSKFISLTLLSLLGFGLINHAVPFYSGTLGPSLKKYPYSVVSYLKGLVRPGEVISLLASPDWGGFITLQGQGSIKPIIDDRNTLIGEGLYREFFGAANIASDWLAFADKVQADYFIISAKSPVRCEVERRNLEIEFEDRDYILVKLRNESE